MKNSAIAFILMFMLGCSTIPKYPYVFEPASSSDIHLYYVLGTPYASVECDCADIRVSMYPTYLNEKYYMRAFISYKNISAVPYLFQPLDSLLLIIEENETSSTVVPESPNAVIRSIDITKNTVLFFQALSAGLEAASVQQTTITGPSGTYKLNDTSRKQQAVIDRAASEMVGTEIMGEAIKGEFSSTVLRRHTIFPDNTLAGFAYFPATGHTKPATYSKRDLEKYIASHKFTLAIGTSCGSKSIPFKPAVGE